MPVDRTSQKYPSGSSRPARKSRASETRPLVPHASPSRKLQDAAQNRNHIPTLGEPRPAPHTAPPHAQRRQLLQVESSSYHHNSSFSSSQGHWATAHWKKPESRHSKARQRPLSVPPPPTTEGQPSYYASALDDDGEESDMYESDDEGPAVWRYPVLPSLLAAGTSAGLASTFLPPAPPAATAARHREPLPNIEEDDSEIRRSLDTASVSASHGSPHWTGPSGTSFPPSAASTPALSYTQSPLPQDFISDDVPATPRDGSSVALPPFDASNADAHAHNYQRTLPPVSATSNRPTHALPVFSHARARYAESFEDGAGADDLMDLDTDPVCDSSSRLPPSSVRFATPALSCEDATAQLNTRRVVATRGSSAPVHLLYIAFQQLTARIAKMQETVRYLDDPAVPFVNCASACVETVLWMLARSEHVAQIALYRTSPHGVDVAFVDGHGRVRVLWRCNAAVLPYVVVSGAYVNADTVAVGDNLFSQDLDALVTEKAAAAKIFRILLTGTRFQPRARAAGFFDFEGALNFPHARKIELATTVDCALCDLTLNAADFKPTVSARDIASLLAWTVCPEKAPVVDASRVIVKDAMAHVEVLDSLCRHVLYKELV